MESNFYEAVPAALQNAALQPELWPSLLHTISKQVGGAGAALFNTSVRGSVAPCSPEIEEMHQSYFEDEWFKIDTRYRGLPVMMRNGIAGEPDFITESEMKRDPFYQDFLERHGRKWFAGLGFRVADEFWCLSVQRETARGPFQLDDLAHLGALMRPFRDAATIARTLGEVWLDGSMRTLDAIGHAAFTCDRQGYVLDRNPAAGEIEALQVGEDRRLRLGYARADDAVNAMIGAALRLFPIALSGPAACRVTLPDCDLTFRAIRLSGTSRMLFTGAALLILVKRVNAKPGVLLSARFGLSPAETRVAVALSQGESVASIARAANVQPSTIRTQLKSVFSKTATRSQSQLVALIARLQ